MTKIISAILIVLLVVIVNVAFADWQSSAQEACQSVKSEVAPGLPPQLKPCRVMCRRSDGKSNVFPILADGTECLLKRINGVCQKGQCVPV